MRALIVDDSSTTRYVLRHCLNKAGFEVCEAGDGREALSMLLKDGPVDLALIDWSMPEMNGLELLTILRADQRFDQMKVVMVTVESGLKQLREVLASGATEYIMKPFTREMVLDKLQILGF